MKFTRLVHKYGPEVGAIATLIFVASVESIFEFSSGDYAVAFITGPAVDLSLLLAALLALNIVWFERRR